MKLKVNIFFIDNSATDVEQEIMDYAKVRIIFNLFLFSIPFQPILIIFISFLFLLD